MSFEINWLNLFNSIIAGLFFYYVHCRLFWMVIYQWRYNNNAGEEYYLYGKEYVLNKYKKSSNGNEGK